MKKINFTLAVLLCTSLFSSVMAAEAINTKYRRSSLHTMLIESERFPMKDTVIAAFFEAPFPDKYDEHNFGEKKFDHAPYALTEEEKKGLKKSTSKVGDFFGNLGAGALTDLAATEGIAIDPLTFELDRTLLPELVPGIINKYLTTNHVAQKMVAKWFNRQADGSFDLSLISQRGEYDATDMAAGISKASVEGKAKLAAAGEELIGNTFLVVNKFKFVSNEIPANLARLTAYMAANRLGNSLLIMGAKKAADIAYKAASVGYSVYATSYLYKLNWNDSVAAVFYNDYYFDKSSPDAKKKEAFDNTDLFKLEFVGSEEAKGLVMIDFKVKAKNARPIDVLIKTATIRTVDAVYAKLQREYDVFMPKTSLLTTEPLTAKIGMKEGLEGGEKFEVLEKNVDPQTFKTKYVRKGIITVDKKLLWDNRYNAGMNPEAEDGKESKEDAQTKLECTTFKGSGDFAPGMLIRQIK